MPKLLGKRPRPHRLDASSSGKKSVARSSQQKDPRKIRGKRTKVAEDDLAWRSIHTGAFGGLDGGGGMMMLEELDDVDVEWEEGGEGKKVATFVNVDTGTKKMSKGKGKGKAVEAPTANERGSAEEAADQSEEGKSDADEGASPASERADGEDGEEQEEGLPNFAQVEADELDAEDSDMEATENAPFDDGLLPAWHHIPLHPFLKHALLAVGFTDPTEIQTRALPSGLSGRDVVGVAETGSGKTLAYSLPVLSTLLTCPAPRRKTRRPLAALILCPTRELALQVVDHLKRISDALPSSSSSSSSAAGTAGAGASPPRISIGSVVGGLSAQKQKRILDRGCDVLVATPGRLWDLIKADDQLAADIRAIRYLVIDEADRMIENGHFAELEHIVRLTGRNSGSNDANADDDDPVFVAAAAAASSGVGSINAREDMQTFVFSATMSKDLQQNLKRRSRARANSKGKKMTALEDLVDRLDFRDANPVVIDLSPEGGTVKTLKESMVECVSTEKDLYLYYFLLRYPGRSLVFVGSIDGIRRLVPLFEVLQIPVYPLHSQLQQKQRLKNLDRFKSSPSAVLIATDVASRGLDIPQVDHVIHFNLPRTADAYIHRSGRTARANNPGFALQLCSPDERGIQRGLLKSLGRETALPELPIESGFLPKLKERIRLAKAIEKAGHLAKKENHQRSWLKETAEAMDIDLEGEMLAEVEGSEDDENPKKKRGGKGQKRQEDVTKLKMELQERLAEPLMARGVSARYPTSGSKVIVDELLASTALLGAKTTRAWDEVHHVKKRKMGGGKRKPATSA